ncbi:DJ-1/PfpI family protein [Ruminococcaceae bacterium OttesenSCG-928-I18]|nr:DJ-1/PfpI family protein [Ruminococcaceae bacterium OttesenSCG-928-I18]
MGKKAVVFLAEGFEEIEGLTQVDMLRRAGLTVLTVGVTGKTVTGAHGISVLADVEAGDFSLPEEPDLVVLPGGMPGTTNLAQSEMVKDALREAAAKGRVIGAICAAPTVLHGLGLLEGKRFTAFPGFLEGEATGAAIEVDGNIITGRSAGVALQFAKALLTAVLGSEQAEETVSKVYPE